MDEPTAQHERDASLAKTLAPEDVRPGDYVAVLDVEHQYPAIVWTCDPRLGEEESVHRVRLRPSETSPPLRVVDACLPFVFVKPPKGAGRTLDLRAVRLARLDRDYAKRVCQSLSEKKAKKKKR